MALPLADRYRILAVEVLPASPLSFTVLRIVPPCFLVFGRVEGDYRDSLTVVGSVVLEVDKARHCFGSGFHSGGQLGVSVLLSV
jgi:hypothetical protein